MKIEEFQNSRNTYTKKIRKRTEKSFCFFTKVEDLEYSEAFSLYSKNTIGLLHDMNILQTISTGIRIRIYGNVEKCSRKFPLQKIVVDFWHKFGEIDFLFSRQCQKDHYSSSSVENDRYTDFR